MDEYENFREKGIIGVKVDEGDQLLSAALTDRNEPASQRGPRADRGPFPPEEQTRPMGRADARGEGDRLGRG